MALADTRDAIGAVSQLLYDRLRNALNGLSIGITIGQPETTPPTGFGSDARLNLFLYRLEVDGNLRNVPLDAGLPTPLWLVLHYLLTAYDNLNSGDSDTVAAHKTLGAGIRALNDLNFRGLYADSIAALSDNPDRLKISFDEADPDLITKLIQHTDGRFRLSAAFQVRPVMLASGKPGAAELLVGVDYSTEPGTIIGADGIRLPVLPSLGPRIASLSPESVQVGDTFEVSGRDLGSGGLVVELGPAQLPIIAQRPDWLRVEVPDVLGDGERISAGSHPLVAVELLPGGRRRSSNLLVAALRPTLSDAAPAGLLGSVLPDGTPVVYGNLDLEGVLMGAFTDALLQHPIDDIQAILYRPAEPGVPEVLRSFDTFEPVPIPPAPPSPAPQTWMRLIIPSSAPLPQGRYRVILRVNGQQARNSPLVELVAP